MRSPRKSHHAWHGWGVSILALAAFTLRTYRLGAQSLWYDEGFSIWLAGKSLAEITGGDFNPPLFYYALHFWLQLAGTTEFATRFLSLLPGLLLVPLTYVLGRRLLDAPTGLVGALILSISPFLLWYSQEARMYTLAGFLVTLSSYLLIRALLTGGLFWWVGYSLATIAAAYTHYYAFLILPVHGLLVLWSTWRRQHGRPWLAWLATQGGLALALLPWTPFLLRHYHAQGTTYWPGALSLSFIARRTLFELVSGGLLNDRMTQQVAVGYLALALVGLVASLSQVSGLRSQVSGLRSQVSGLRSQVSGLRSQVSGLRSQVAGRRPHPSVYPLSHPLARLATLPGQACSLRPGQPSFPVAGSRLFLLAYLVIPLFLTFALTHNRPKFFPRYLLFTSPALFLLTAAGLRTLLPPLKTDVPSLLYLYLRRALFILALCLLLSSSALALRNWFFDPGYGKDDFQGIARYLEANVASDEAVILSSGHAFPVFTYYYHRPNWFPIPPDPTPAPSATDALSLSIGTELNQIAEGRRGLWLVLWQNDVVDPNGVLLKLLDQVGRSQPVGETFRGIQVRHYALPPAARFPEQAEPQHPIGASLPGGLVLLGYDILNAPVPSDQAADLVLYWRATEPIQADYRISLRLRDGSGHQVSQLDRRPAGFMYPTWLWKSGEEVLGRHALPLPPGLPPGLYTLELILYPADDIADAYRLPLGQLSVIRPPTVQRGGKGGEPRPDDLDIPYRMRVTFGPLELLGHDLAPADVLPGDGLDLTLFWRAVTTPSADLELVAVVGAMRTLPLVFPYPTGQWQAGDVFRTHHRLTLPADLPAGEVSVGIRVDRPGGEPLAPPAVLTTLHVGSREHRFDVPAGIQHPLWADLGGYVTFLGYDQDVATLKAGGTLHLTLYWRARQEMALSFTVFTHLLGGDGLIWGQQDSIPLRGARPTTSWLPGEVLVDTYDITVRPDASAGDYLVEVGMYDAVSGERLPVFDESGRRLPDDRIIIGKVLIER